jgi:hypothetical protein
VTGGTEVLSVACQIVSDIEKKKRSGDSRKYVPSGIAAPLHMQRERELACALLYLALEGEGTGLACAECADCIGE